MFVDAVLFDFHQTLFGFEGDEPWLLRAAEACGRPLSPERARELATRIDDARGWPDVLALGEHRDRSPAAHRSFVTSWLRLAGLPGPLIDALYARLVTPDCWYPYPNVARVLGDLVGAGVPVGVLSNTGWDLRATFERYGLRRHVASFTLSCERGLEKPDPDLFLAACASIGSAPERTLMVGDNPATDGGCVAAGLLAYLVPSGPGRGLDAVSRIAGVQVSAPAASANCPTSPAR